MSSSLALALTAAALASQAASAAQAPSPPELRVEAVSERSIVLRWDGVGVRGVVYRVYANGNTVGMTEALTFTDAGLKPGIEYCYQVAAVDRSGRESARGATVCATAGRSPPPPPPADPPPERPPAPAEEPQNEPPGERPPGRRRSLDGERTALA